MVAALPMASSTSSAVRRWVPAAIVWPPSVTASGVTLIASTNGVENVTPGTPRICAVPARRSAKPPLSRIRAASDAVSTSRPASSVSPSPPRSPTKSVRPPPVAVVMPASRSRVTAKVPPMSPNEVASLASVAVACMIFVGEAKPTVTVPTTVSSIAVPVVLISSASVPLRSRPSTTAGSSPVIDPSAANVPSEKSRIPAATAGLVFVSARRTTLRLPLAAEPIAKSPARSRKPPTESVPEPATEKVGVAVAKVAVNVPASVRPGMPSSAAAALVIVPDVPSSVSVRVAEAAVNLAEAPPAAMRAVTAVRSTSRSSPSTVSANVPSRAPRPAPLPIFRAAVPAKNGPASAMFRTIAAVPPVGTPTALAPDRSPSPLR